MEKTRRSTYWLILPVLVLVVGLLAQAASPTQSRYTMVTGWQMSLSQVDTNLHFDLLTEDGQRTLLQDMENGQKILLQDMSVSDTRQIPLTLTSAGSVETVTLTVESTYLTAALSWEHLGVFEESVTEILTVAATEEAKQTITTPTDASAKLTLTWEGGALQSEVLVRLHPANVQEDTSSEAATVSDGGAEVKTTGTGEDTTGTGEDTIGTGEDTTGTDGDTTDTSGDTTNTDGDTTDTSGDATNTDGETTDPEDTTTDPVEPEVGTWLTAMSKFAAQGALPILMDVPEGCDAIQVEFAVGDGTAGVFPAGTRYSIGDDAVYTLLYEPGMIRFVPEQGVQTVALLVDFSAVELDRESLLNVTASALQGETVISISSVRTQASLDLPQVELKGVPMVTESETIQFLMPIYGDADSFTVKRLPLTENQEEAMPLVILEEETGILTISSNDAQAKAGTYKAELTWSWKGLQVARQEIVFYVNYTPYVQITKEISESTQTADVV